MFLGLQLSDMYILNLRGRQKADDFLRMEVTENAQRQLNLKSFLLECACHASCTHNFR